ncbi:hypothetical protein NEUTE1DRAFT_115156 [Neurospora tetrasperma FGSC 2508]|uniref:CFEM domain-containing protein n=1 Tax=Neurospora tetrasperma (strain FGSC 2508 / ATCC MYA-4615 / P0657) TaxID=510951 RepID=F8N2Q8_NEUT8|nr:uncharacterized protein NEUTE1DRAFT_115156 [Neurospora tetrasperma FGSC 2508]EGO53322.1 hypothetical protein NEUTE1DRAFT_115156 [Neurospora tetrasperma FGSC 2508]
MYIISFVVGGLAGSAMALEYADLAPCGAYNMNCPPYPDGRPNLECLCKDANFVNGIHDCVFETCNTQEAENTLDLAAIYCTDPKYKSPDCPCLDPLLQPGASPAAAVASDPGVNSNSDSGSGSSADNDDVSNSSGSTNPNTNTISDDSATPNGGNNDNTFVATATATNGDGAVSSNSVETGGEGGGLKTVTAYVAPKVTELANTASTASAGASKTNELDHADASTPTSASSGAAEMNGTGAREMGNLRERVLLAVVLGSLDKGHGAWEEWRKD